MPLVAAFGPTFALAVGAIGFRALRERNGAVGAILRRLAQMFGSLFQLCHPRLRLLDEGLPTEDDFDEF